MIKVGLTAFVHVGMKFQETMALYELREEAKRVGFPPNLLDNVFPTKPTESDKTRVKQTLAQLKTICRILNLPTSAQLLDNLDDTIPETAREYSVYMSSIWAEINTKLFMYIPSHRALFFECTDILSDRARTAFPSAYKEIREAGNCFSCARYTATVFHAMRAAEIGLRSLGKKLKVGFPFPIELAEWNSIIEKVEAEIRKISQLPRSKKREIDQQFYSEAAANFRYFKDAWRIRVSHVRETYDEAQAHSVLNHCREFMEILATKLSEQKS